MPDTPVVFAPTKSIGTSSEQPGLCLACGDDDDARTTLMEIIRTIPDLRAFDGGSLENAVGMETFAAVLLTINIRHKVRAGLRLSGV